MAVRSSSVKVASFVGAGDRETAIEYVATSVGFYFATEELYNLMFDGGA